MKQLLIYLHAFLAFYGFSVELFLAGIAGGIAFLTKNEKMKWWQKFLSVLSGGFSATYLTPWIADLMSVDDSNKKYGIAFLLGYGGLKFIEFLITTINHRINSKFTVS